MLEFGYIALTLGMTAIVLWGYHHGLKQSIKNESMVQRKIRRAALGILAWLVYVFLISKSGLLHTYELPPRFPVFLIFPVFLFTGITLYRHRHSPIFEAIPISWTNYIQGFRILVESLFVGSVAAGILHPEVTIEGYNYDMIYAISILIISLLVFQFMLFSTRLILIWNYLGLLVLLSVILVFTTTTYVPGLWGSELPLSPIEMMNFPFTLVPAYLMPLAVFIHLFSIMQIRRQSSKP